MVENRAGSVPTICQLAEHMFKLEDGLGDVSAWNVIPM